MFAIKNKDRLPKSKKPGISPKDINRIKTKIAGYSHEDQVNIRNEMISGLIHTNYDSDSRKTLFEMIEYIRDLWS